MSATQKYQLLLDPDGGESLQLPVIVNADGTYTLYETSVDGLQLTTAGVTDSLNKRFVTDAELALLSGVSAAPGTVVASSAVTVDANKDVTGIRNLTFDKTGSITMGTLSSANDTSGVALSSAKTKADQVCADTGGSALTAGNYRARVSRFLIGTAISSGADISTYGHENLLKMIASVNTGGNQGGALGHLESAGTLTLTGSINVVKAGVASFVDLATGATIAASTVVSAYGVNPANFGTVTGRTAVIHVTAPFAGTWGSLFDISGLNGLAAAAAGATQDLHGVIYKDGVKYTFPLYRA